ncbi:MAG: glycosyltransferase family 4 protein [Burkholderiaceae bacterium]
MPMIADPARLPPLSMPLSPTDSLANPPVLGPPAIAPTGLRAGGTVMLAITGLGVGGAERLVLDLARGYQNEGYRVVLVALENDLEIVPFSDVSGLDIRVLDMQHTLLSLMRALRSLHRMIRDESIRLIHAHLFHPVLLATLLRTVHPSVRLVFTSHNYAGFTRPRSLFLRLTKRFRHADILLGPGQHPEINADPATIIANGVRVPDTPLARHAPGPGEPFVFLFLSRLVPEKNVTALIASAAQLRARYPQRRIEVQIAGDGPERAAAEAYAVRHGCTSFVRFLGMRGDVDALMRDAHVFVLPSLWEGLPIAALEAGAMAMPVIASPVGALPGLLADGRGYLVGPAALTDAMASVLDDYDEALARGRRLYEMIHREYDKSGCVGRHLALYETVMAACAERQA